MTFKKERKNDPAFHDGALLLNCTDTNIVETFQDTSELKDISMPMAANTGPTLLSDIDEEYETSSLPPGTPQLASAPGYMEHASIDKQIIEYGRAEIPCELSCISDTVNVRLPCKTTIITNNSSHPDETGTETLCHKELPPPRSSSDKNGRGDRYEIKSIETCLTELTSMMSKSKSEDNDSIGQSLYKSESISHKDEDISPFVHPFEPNGKGGCTVPGSESTASSLNWYRGQYTESEIGSCYLHEGNKCLPDDTESNEKHSVENESSRISDLSSHDDTTSTISKPRLQITIETEIESDFQTSKDPFDLVSDDDSKPRKYQPIKRKLSSTHLTMTTPMITTTAPNADIADCDLLAPERSECKRLRHCCRVAFVHSNELLEKVNQLPRIKGRAQLMYSLVQAYGLLQFFDVLSPRPASTSEILGFHSADYINFLQDVSIISDTEDSEHAVDEVKLGSEAEGFGLSYDCPMQAGIFETASLVSGGSIVAAESLITGQADIAINWYGGWHHAKRDSASGFCYINDIVLAILKLKEKFDRVLYVDIDLHHGDGVEEAFSLTPKVMTVSFHKYAAGFFPGSGAEENVGFGRGKFHTVNVPLHDGIKDAEFCSLFFRVMKLVRAKFRPEAVVLQCGADGLSEDPMASFNLSHIGLARCVCSLLAWKLPTLLLGGGGYNFAATSVCWTFLTGLVAHKKLPADIPEHEHLLEYGPDYQLSTTVGNRRDSNTRQYLRNLLTRISCNLNQIDSSV